MRCDSYADGIFTRISDGKFPNIRYFEAAKPKFHPYDDKLSLSYNVEDNVKLTQYDCVIGEKSVRNIFIPVMKECIFIRIYPQMPQGELITVSFRDAMDSMMYRMLMMDT